MAKIKVCGINNLSFLKQIIKLKPNFLGFIFYKGSKRYIDFEFMKAAIQILPSSIIPVAVIVDHDHKFIKKIIEIAPNIILQFHGSETEEFCSSFGMPYWKTVHIKNSKDLLDVNVYESADAILLETKSDGSIGGTGRSFDWTILKELDFDNKKYILAGGIGLQNILQAKSIGPWCLDINSMIETEPGVKSIDKAKEIFKLIADV